ncbi:hypothetical protein GCM10007108_06290 [Thermogymnomonas acidicola]|uniref:Uncharacterized protein n=1 Tax=Thermogymnomonas acidicola TaxID=399579 RepID=A0AA37F947_9ARCH|nr:hypothetical protein [Thermogymnomonas acidicola]GGM70990.1 hypothetical protein GCM10007108_06290 [Thermogymnomonas acidicola]
MVSPLPPLAIGFFGLGVGYFVVGGSYLANFPKDKDESVNRTLGQWMIWMPGFMQFITGTYIMLGLTIFSAFQSSPVLYMAGLAFTAYGVHWFAMGISKYRSSDTRVDGFMAIAFLWISITGAFIFYKAGDIPVMVLFIILTLIYIFDIPASFTQKRTWGMGKATFQVIGGVWLMYLMFAAASNFALGLHFPL